MPRVAIISHLFPTQLNPHEGKFILDQLELLSSEEKVEVDLIVPTPFTLPFTKRRENRSSQLHSPATRTERIHYLSFPNKRFPTVIQRSLSNNLSHFLQAKKYDVIHIHWLYPDGLAIPRIKTLTKKVILTIHGSDWYQNVNNSTLFPLLIDSLREADLILASGPKLKEDILTEINHLKTPIEVAYNFVDSQKYIPISTSNKTDIRNSLKWDKNKIHALTVSNIRHEKGVDRLVQIASENERFKNIHFHIIGKKDDSIYSKDVEKSIENNPLSNITLYKPVKPDELISYYQAADFYVLPSRREGFNVSILEAGACGLPIVCTRVGGNSEVINPEIGIMTSPDHNLEESIITMISKYKSYDPSVINRSVTNRYGNHPFLKAYKKHLFG
ncbi:MAG: glycosyltransferase family 4 protein [Balneola sp.]